MKTFAELYESLRDTQEFQVEQLSLAFTESLLLRMEALNDLSGTELADRIGTSQAYVSKLLKGKANFTLETLVKLARALDCHVQPPLLIPNEKPATILTFVRSPKNTNAFRAEHTQPKAELQNDDNIADPAAAA